MEVYTLTAVYLISIILGISFQTIIKKPFTQKTSGKGLWFFGLVTSIFAMTFFIITSKSFTWNSGVLVYSAFFALSYTLTTVCGLYAIACGSISLSALIISYSLIMPTVYGLIFLNDPIGIRMIIGLLLLMISLFLINKKDESSAISLKWIVFVSLAFIGNGMCSVIQKMQQIAFDEEYKSEFMIMALAMVIFIFFLFTLKNEQKEIKVYAKAGWHLAALCGIANGITNLFVMILAGMMPVSVMFPLISAGGIIVTYIVSRFFYKETLTRTQFIGFLIGIAAVICLN